MEDAPVGCNIEAGELVTFFHFGVGGDADGNMMTTTAEGEDCNRGAHAAHLPKTWREQESVTTSAVTAEKSCYVAGC